MTQEQALRLARRELDNIAAEPPRATQELQRRLAVVSELIRASQRPSPTLSPHPPHPPLLDAAAKLLEAHGYIILPRSA